jgi:hypothetical protein
MGMKPTSITRPRCLVKSVSRSWSSRNALVEEGSLEIVAAMHDVSTGRVTVLE